MREPEFAPELKGERKEERRNLVPLRTALTRFLATLEVGAQNEHAS